MNDHFREKRVKITVNWPEQTGACEPPLKLCDIKVSCIFIEV